MRFIFCSRCSNLNINFKNAEKNWTKSFCFCDNCIWIGWVKLSLFRREYFPSAVNVLTSSLKTLLITMRDILRLCSLHRYQRMWESFCCLYSNSVWDRLPCSLSEGPQKKDFLDNYLTTFLGARNFENTSPMRVSFFLKMFQT